MKNRFSQYEQGAVAIFSVVFATLLVMVVTVSFLTLMISDQRQSINADLSEDAYDSAMAGVEDAKRLITKQIDCRGSSTPYCQNLLNLFNGAHKSTSCTSIIDAGIAGTPGDKEVVVGGSESDGLNQAYTCVKVSMNTDDYLGTLSGGSSGSALVPLKGVSSFSKIRVSWYSQADRGARQVNLPDGSASLLPLPPQSDWDKTTPSMLRVSVIKPGGSFNLDDFNTADKAVTAFLYPSENGLDDTSAVSGALNIAAHDSPRDLGNNTLVSKSGPKAIKCSESLQLLQRYFCRTTLEIGGSTNNAYLALGSIYNKASYRIELLDSHDNVVLLRDVQPSVDSTGRASDIFRRVEARVELRNDVVYPDAALSTLGDLCKDFIVTDDTKDFFNNCSW